MALLTATLVIALQQPDALRQHEALVTSNAKLPPQHMLSATQLNEMLWPILESGTVQTAGDFALAASLVQTSYPERFIVSMVQYELTYTAVALGDKAACQRLGETWDALTMNLGRYRTIGAVEMKGMGSSEGYWQVRPAAKLLTQILMAPEKAKPQPADNPEVAKLFEEDQTIRSGPLDQKAIEKMVEGDRKRMARIREILKQGKLGTGDDFVKAAFLYQHGNTFDDYHTAHELSLCAMILGDLSAKWIGAASYDRMLGSCGHKQRWGTQFVSDLRGKYKLASYDSSGISDFQRKAVIGHTIQESLDRAKSIGL